MGMVAETMTFADGSHIRQETSINSVFSDFANSLITYCRSLSQFCGCCPWQPMDAILCTRSLLGFMTRPPASRQYCAEAAANSLTCRITVLNCNQKTRAIMYTPITESKKNQTHRMQSHCWHCSCQKRSFESRVHRELYPAGVPDIQQKWAVTWQVFYCWGHTYLKIQIHTYRAALGRTCVEVETIKMWNGIRWASQAASEESMWTRRHLFEGGWTCIHSYVNMQTTLALCKLQCIEPVLAWCAWLNRLSD